MRYPKLVLILVVSLPALLLVVLLTAAGKVTESPVPVAVSPQAIGALRPDYQTSYVRQRRIYGTAEAVQQSQMGFQRTGVINRVFFDEGQWVAKGTVLAELDIAGLDAQLAESRAALARTQANARLAKLSEQRVASLVSQKLESPQRLDESRENTRAAFASVDEIKARLQGISVELNNSQLIAPFDGYIVARMVDEGSVAGPGQTVLILQQAGGIDVRVAMARETARSLDKDAPFVLTRDNAHYPARIKSVSAQRTRNTRTVDVIFHLDEPQGTVLAGDLLQVSFPQTINENGYWLPRSAITAGVRGMWSVLTVSELGQETAIIPKAVSVLYGTEHKVFVSGALSSSDYVVFNGTHRIVPGQLVVASDIDSSLWTEQR
jgi:RND family efflux transporter MFP subunit